MIATISSDGRWREVRRDAPCPACGKPDWCAWAPDNTTLRCMREGKTPPGMRLSTADRDGATLFVPDSPQTGDGKHDDRNSRQTAKSLPQAKHEDVAQLAVRFQSKLTNGRLAALTEATGVPAEAWKQLGAGWCDREDLRFLHAGGKAWGRDGHDYPDGAWCFAERGGNGRIVGFSLRAPGGRKGAPSRSVGMRRGLIVPSNLHELPDPVLCVEGASDVAACVAMGLAAVGRPSNRAGVADLADLLDGRELLVIGEQDGKAGGSWPGRDGAKAVAQQLAGRLNKPVAWSLPPTDVKDIRGWFMQSPRPTATEVLDALQQAAHEITPAKRSTADLLVDLALQRYQLGQNESGDVFAVDREGPRVAIMFNGGTSDLRAKLSRAYRDEHGKTPNASALGDALVALQGQALDASPEPIGLRVTEGSGESQGHILVDLGDTTGRVVAVKPDGWTVVNDSPVLFRRTALTGALPEPVGDHDPGTLADLRTLLNVGDDVWPLVCGWLVAACIPEIPHPVLMLGGEQGTGKSTAAQLIVSLVDPSPALLRSEPRDPESWAMMAANSWCAVIDNVSRIPGWWSDAICKAVTGDGWVRRKLYTDSSLSVLSFRRCIALTSIDTGALRSDLGDRLLIIDLERIDDKARRTEAEVNRHYRELQPRLLAGLFSAVSRVRAVLPDIDLTEMPRMADFARVLAALDQSCPELTSGRALGLYMAQRNRIAEDVVEGDVVASAIVRLLQRQSLWSGNASALLTALEAIADERTRQQRVWPTSGRAIAGRLKRLAPSLAKLGICHTPPRPNDKSRTHHLELIVKSPPEPPNRPDQPSQVRPAALDAEHAAGDTGDPVPLTSENRPSNRPIDNATCVAAEPKVGGVGGSGGEKQHLSGPTLDWRVRV